MSLYPDAPSARDRFVVGRRGAREGRDPWRHQGVIVEEERAEDGSIVRVATVFLTGRECPWRCVMCDLWRYTIEQDTPAGAIPAQVAAALRQVEAGGGGSGERGESGERDGGGRVATVKLYNAGSFFDPRAVPEADYDDVAARLLAWPGLDRVIVESHPALIGARVDRFVAALARSEVAAPRLEVAMGLETAHPVALERLHKRITLEQFARAAADLRRRNIALRVFLLIAPPFIAADEQDAWLLRSIDFAFDCGAAVVSLVPTRSGNGAMEALQDEGEFEQPTIEDIERSFTAALSHVRARAGAAHNGRVFVDLWDLERFANPDAGEADLAARRERLRMMNLEQRVRAEVAS